MAPFERLAGLEQHVADIADDVADLQTQVRELRERHVSDLEEVHLVERELRANWRFAAAVASLTATLLFAIMVWIVTSGPGGP